MAVELKHCKVCKTSMLLKFFQSNLKTDIMYKSCDKCRARIRSQFACDLCSYKCRLSKDLKKHKDCVHLKLTPFACGDCDLSFGRACELKKHKENTHLKFKLFACDLCNYKRGRRPSELKNHKLTCTGELKCSKGELAVMKVLDEMKIDYLYNTNFWGVRDKGLLRWDFIISPAMNPKVIEFDGKCHYFAIRYGGITEEQAQENLTGSKRRDAIKDGYCSANNIPILRIPYYDKENIEKLINEFVI